MRKLYFYIALSLIAAAVLSVQYHNIRRAVFENQEYHEREVNFLSLQKGIDCYKAEQRYYWKSRIASCFIASKWCSLNSVFYNEVANSRLAFIKSGSAKLRAEFISVNNRFSNAIAAHQIIILAVMFALVVVIAKNKLLWVLGTGAALCYAWTPAAHGHVCAWDSWSITVWAIILLVNTTRYKKHIVWLIPALSVLKETTLVLTVLILFWEDVPLKSRIKMFSVAIISTLGIKSLLGIISGNGGGTSYTLHYENRCRTGEYWIIHRNWNTLFRWSNFNHVFFSAAGVWAAIFLLPLHKQYKMIAGAYLAIIFIPCVITEARLFQELVPLFFVGYDSIDKKVLRV